MLEGADGSGRSTQIRLLREWLERRGHAVTEVGLRRSSLVSKELTAAKEGHTLGHTTMSIFYATDFADQLEHVMVPALRAGYIVLADRYIYTLIARDIARGADPDWVERHLRHGAGAGRGLLPARSARACWSGGSSRRTASSTTGSRAWTSAWRRTCSTASSSTRG